MIGRGHRAVKNFFLKKNKRGIGNREQMRSFPIKRIENNLFLLIELHKFVSEVIIQFDRVDASLAWHRQRNHGEMPTNPPIKTRVVFMAISPKLMKILFGLLTAV